MKNDLLQSYESMWTRDVNHIVVLIDPSFNNIDAVSFYDKRNDALHQMSDAALREQLARKLIGNGAEVRFVGADRPGWQWKLVNVKNKSGMDDQ